jgi:hypothetical protein
LLTGSTPLEKTTLRQAANAEIIRQIREVDPPKPSTRLSGSRIPASDRKRLAGAGSRLIMFDEAWGKKDKADKWRKRLGASCQQ